MDDHTARMLSEAQDRLHDADILSHSLAAVSDSASLLRILALEVLLKAWLYSQRISFKRNHNYKALWGAFSQTSQAAIIKRRKRVGSWKTSR